MNEDEGKIRISPLIRKIAKRNNVDITKVKGSGPRGRITKKDIIAYSKEGAVAEVNMKEENSPERLRIKSSTNLSDMRKIIAQRMSLSKSTIPHIVLKAKADATNLFEFREQLKERVMEKYGVKITYTDFILKATALALRENIEINSTLKDDKHIIYDDINIGMAISINEGLIVPTIFSCDKLKLLSIAKKRIELIHKAKNSKLTFKDIEGGTFTVTNLGMFGIRSSSAVINPPQAAILAVGEIYREPAIVNERIEFRFFIDLSVSCDHRIIDGEPAARFLTRIVELISNPLLMLV